MTNTRTAPSKFSTILAVTSFAIGTVLLLLHLLFPNSGLILFSGYWFVIGALAVNGLTFLYLLVHLAVYRLDRETIVIRILILLSNIPIAFLYLNIVTHNNLF